MATLQVPLVLAYMATFPGPKRLARRALYTDMAARSGRALDHRLLGKWRRRVVAIPDDAREAMVARVVDLWPGTFDRAGLVAALSVYPKETS